MLKKTLFGFVLVVVMAALAGSVFAQDRKERGKDAHFEDAIAAFETADAKSPPARDSILFVGSSSIRFWKSLEEDMKGLPVINRGFGGSQMNHLIYNVARIITPYEPRIIVVYEGDNDLAEGSGKTPDRVLADYRKLVELVHASKSDVQIYFLAIKPSKLRWEQWPEMKRANALIERCRRTCACGRSAPTALPSGRTRTRPRSHDTG